MELLFQAWDELDDALAALRHVVVRYAVADIAAAAAGVIARLRRFAREVAIAKRRSPRVRAA